MVKKTDKDGFDELLKSGKTLVCDFYADWCGPCKMLAPVMESVSEEFDAEFVKVNVDENYELAARYGVMSIPLVAVFKGGEEAGRSVGYSSKTEMREFLKEKI